MRYDVGRFRRPMRRGAMEQMVSLISLGDGSTLSLDFTAMSSLDSRFTFSRSGGGSYTASDGLLYGFDQSTTSNTIGTGSKTFTLSATAGVNRRYAVGDLIIASSGANSMSGSVTSYDPSTQSLVCSMASSSGSGTFTTWIIGNRQPRFDYDPTTLAPRGLLIESSATNIVTYSNDFANAIWQFDNSGATNPSVSTVSQSGPDGASTVMRITFNKTGGTFSRIRQTLTGTASTAYTMSVWMKANTASGGASTQNVGIRIGADPAGFNCVVTTTWKRFQYTYTLSGTDAAAQIMLWDNIVGNDETADVLVYGCQIELGSGASSYIPTGASSVQRAADSCSIALSTFGFNTAEGTFYVDFFRKNVSSGSGSAIATDYASTRWLGIDTASGSNTVNLNSWGGTTSSANGSTRNKVGASYGAWTGSAVPVSLCVNNTAAVTGNRDFNPSNATYLTIGAASSSSGTNPPYGVAGRDWLNNCVAAVKYWPVRLPDNTLRVITA